MVVIYFDLMTHSGDGLLLCWYFITSSPEPLLIEKLMMKLTTKSPKEFSQARY
jgi:hypothetical protein